MMTLDPAGQHRVVRNSEFSETGHHSKKGIASAQCSTSGTCQTCGVYIKPVVVNQYMLNGECS